MTTTKLRRAVTAGGLEVRTTANGVSVEGHASTFGQAYDMGWYQETVAPGAFARTLKTNPDVRLLVNHDGLPLARTRSGTLDLAEDNSGLYMRSTLDPTDPDVKRLVPKMARGDLNEMSFSFGLSEDGDEWSEDYTARTLRHLNLEGGDVSIVTYPANPNATVSLRSRALLKTPGKLRDLYRSVGTRSETRALLDNLTTDTTDEDLTALAVLLTTTHRKGTRGQHSGDTQLARIRHTILKYH